MRDGKEIRSERQPGAKLWGTWVRILIRQGGLYADTFLIKFIGEILVDNII